MHPLHLNQRTSVRVGRHTKVTRAQPLRFEKQSREIKLGELAMGFYCSVKRLPRARQQRSIGAVPPTSCP
jgi:hypothetical protein